MPDRSENRPASAASTSGTDTRSVASSSRMKNPKLSIARYRSASTSATGAARRARSQGLRAGRNRNSRAPTNMITRA